MVFPLYMFDIALYTHFGIRQTVLICFSFEQTKMLRRLYYQIHSGLQITKYKQLHPASSLR